jgi:hypothetical protein
MSPEAQEYIKLCLEFNDERDMHKWRAKYVCEQLNFSRRLEVKIRNEIKEGLM